jgi:hypothetical protein
MAKPSTLGVALFAAIGTFLFVRLPRYQPREEANADNDVLDQGFDTGIATTSNDKNIHCELHCMQF